MLSQPLVQLPSKAFKYFFILFLISFLCTYTQAQSIKGRLINKRNIPVPGMKILLVGVPGLKPAITDDNGRFLINKVPAGRVFDYQSELVVIDPDNKKASFSVVVENEIIIIADVKPLPVKTVKVLDPQGDIVSNAQVKVSGNPNLFKTNDKGEATLSGYTTNEQKYLIMGFKTQKITFKRKEKTLIITALRLASDEKEINNIIDLYNSKEEKLNNQQREVENRLKKLEAQLKGELTAEKRALIQKEIKALEKKLAKINEDRKLLKKEAENTIAYLKKKLGIQVEKTKEAEYKKKLALIDKKNSELATKYTIIISVIIITLLIIIALIFFLAGKRLRKQKREIEEKNIILAEQKDQLATQTISLTKANNNIKEKNTELTEQKVILEEQKLVLHEQHVKITKSIEYALNIQQSILPTKESLDEVFGNHLFILYKPKDIVSGDFYWFTKHNNTLFLSSIDCTGHGVPGGFMTMMGNSLLNHIVNERNIEEPADILNELHNRVQKTLKSKEKEERDGDGMDMVFIKIEPDAKKLSYAGAKLPLLIAKNEDVVQIAPSKISIGSTLRSMNKTFGQENFILDGTETFYLASDGYQDQLGFSKKHKRNKKFMKGKFIKLLKAISDEDLATQKAKLQEGFESWKGDEEQTDDVLVIGLKTSFLFSPNKINS